VALEGELWKSLALLLFRPGRLTREYIEGRVRYVQALRIYLTFSIIFFALLGAKVGKFLNLPKEEMVRQMTKGFYSYAPYAMFLLMPVFALWLKLLYLGTGRRYGEHLLFALHTNAFAFAALSLMLLTPDLLWPLEMTLGLWLFAYLPMAMRRVYGVAAPRPSRTGSC
jgi:hypothetical protein